MTVKETDEWKLAAFIEWRPKPIRLTCKGCGGSGKVGGGFKDMDGERDCPDCWGRGWKEGNPTTQQPEVPPELVEHMRRAWWDYFHNNVVKEQQSPC